jgi:hypothetical protein
MSQSIDPKKFIAALPIDFSSVLKAIEEQVIQQTAIGIELQSARAL